MNAATLRTSRLRPWAAARTAALIIGILALFTMTGAASHAPAVGASVTDVPAAHAMSAPQAHAAHAVGPIEAASEIPGAPSLAPTCATCADSHQGALAACAMVIVMAIMLMWPRLTRSSWTARVPLPVRTARVAARVIRPRPSLDSLCISRT